MVLEALERRQLAPQGRGLQTTFEAMCSGNFRAFPDMVQAVADLTGTDLNELHLDAGWKPTYLATTFDGIDGMANRDTWLCLIDQLRTLKLFVAGAQAVERLRGKEYAVLDVGPGTGVFSVLCAWLGAKHVYAVEVNEESANKMRTMVEGCGLSDVIEVMTGNAVTSSFQTKYPIGLLYNENWHAGGLIEKGAQIFNRLSDQMLPEGTILPGGMSFSMALAHIDSSELGVAGHTERVSLSNGSLRRLTDFQEYYNSRFVPGGKIPESVDVDIELRTFEPGVIANAVILRSAFSIGKYVLSPNQGKFLGQDHIIALPSLINVSNVVQLHVGYPIGGTINEIDIRQIA